MESLLRTIKRFIPRSVFHFLQPAYHFGIALLGAVLYRFPSRKLVVIGVTGTKGKTSVAEIMGNICAATGHPTAIFGTLHFKIGNDDRRNLRKMTMPGRFFLQKFLRDAVRAGCTYAVIEMTSEGAKQFRQRFVDMDALIFTNLAPEHIESHGSYEAYREAKLDIARTLARSKKRRHFMAANAGDKEAPRFLHLRGVDPLPYCLKDATDVRTDIHGTTFHFRGHAMSTQLTGSFNLENILAAVTVADALEIPIETIRRGVAATRTIPGRVENVSDDPTLPIIVDYAHTPDSLLALYGAFSGKTIIGILGNTGGGRDTWKRPVMGEIADSHCAEVILTNEDPYDEDPQAICAAMAAGMKRHPTIILDRRSAIQEGIRRARARRAEGEPVVLLITGKGTDPFIMGPNGSKEVWDDKTVVQEEFAR